MTRRFYVNNAPTLTLASPITSGATSLTVSATFAGYPVSFPYFVTLDYGQLSEEIVSVTNVVGTTATIVRGQDGTPAISHAAGATLDFTTVAKDYDEANAHVNASTGVHGISGAVVGASDVQNLTNKTLTSPTLAGTATGSGAINTTGAITTTAGITGGSLSTGGNGTVGGTLAITGASTAASYTANGDGKVAGVVVPKSYANEAAATAASANVTGAVVWLTTPTTAGTAAGLFVYNGSSWIPYKRPRVGARATTNAVQAISASTVTVLNNGGSAAWTATEDSGGFVSATGGTTTPITIPAGLGGLYQVGIKYLQSVNSASRMFGGIVLNGANGNTWFPAYGEAVSNGSVPLSLNAGDTLGVLGFTVTAGNASIGCQVFCYRISD